VPIWKSNTLRAGKAVANFSLAINESFRNGAGEQMDRVQWVKCVAWGKLAEVCGQYLTKGTRAYAEGRLQTRKYDDRGGIERTVTEIVVSQLRLLGGARIAMPTPDTQDQRHPRLRRTPQVKRLRFS